MNLPATQAPAPVITGKDLVDHMMSAMSPCTVLARKADLKHFAKWLDAPDSITAASQLLAMHPGEANILAMRYRNDMIKTHAPATVNRRLCTLRQIVKVGRILGKIFWTLEVPGCKTEPYKDTRGPGVEAIRIAFQVFDDLSTPAFNKYTNARATRDRALIWLLAGVGLRVSEAVNLDREDFDFDGCRVHVKGKGRLEKEWHTIPTQARDALDLWLDYSDHVDTPFIFFSLGPGKYAPTRKRLSTGAVRYITQSLGLGSPHGLRHTAITTGLAETGDPRAVQKYARHASIGTTMIYDDNRQDFAGQVAQKVADFYSSSSIGPSSI